MTTPARAERESLCDLMLDLGPDAPTLCEGWTTRDLAAHLVIRERRPDAAGGILLKPLAEYGEKIRREESLRDYGELVDRVRSGPPSWSPMRIGTVDKLVNTVEFFIHHEDVRRGSPGWSPRELDGDLEDTLYTALSRGARLMARKSPAGLVIEPDGRDPVVAKKPDDGGDSVTVRGPVGEVLMFLYGRQASSEVEIDGPAAAIDAVRTASFGI
jgi:uncharacterized protein (TIGR03085 family)